jgi:beta-glucosidase
MKKKIKEILSKMTLEEKSQLCMGKDSWQTKDFPHLGIPSVLMSDGTNGLRINKTKEELIAEYGDTEAIDFFEFTELSQNSGRIKQIHPATCYPSGSAIASSWDRDLVREIAASVAQECKKRGVSLLLGPAMNIRRSPLGGRSFEYFSEDPFVSGEIAASYVRGLQENGVGACLKHYTCNNSETLRTKTDSIVEERALREIYLAGFERAIKEKPASIMSSYNLLNGVQMAENRRLLTDILRNEWGYEGFVVSDWYAIKDRVAAAKAGGDLEMPYSFFNTYALSDAVKMGKLSLDDLDAMCENILNFVFEYHDKLTGGFNVDYEGHHETARRAIAESCVLLKNEDNILPVSQKKYSKILVLGSIAKKMRYQGGGCALINPTRLDVPYDEIEKRAGDHITVDYYPGYSDDDTTCEAMCSKAAMKAMQNDLVIIFAGLSVTADTEGCDRTRLDIEPAHARLINAVSAVNKNIVVVLSNGEAVTMPWADNAKAILETFMCGQAGGSAIADILFGIVNPSGKLTVSFAKRIEDLAAFPEFPGENARNVYSEGIFVGYRYFEKKAIEPLYPFGHGLSYTDFSYTGISFSREKMLDKEKLEVSFRLKNIGHLAGKEVVQLYVAPPACRLRRPVKELKGFEKIHLNPGEETELSFTLSYRDFAYYDPEFSDWIVDPGVYHILIGASSADIRLSGQIKILQSIQRNVRVRMDTVHAELFKNDLATKLYFDFLVEEGVFTEEELHNKNLLESLQASFVGLYNTIGSYSKRYISKEKFQIFLDDLNKKLGR